MIGFWLPVLLIPWMALPACFLARAMRLTEGGVVFAVMSVSNIDFWWAFNFVSNWANLKYNYMIKDINAEQNRIENALFSGQKSVEEKAQELYKQSRWKWDRPAR